MSSFPYPNWLRPVCSHPFPSPHFTPEEGSHSRYLCVSWLEKGKTHPAVPLSPCHRQPSSLAPAGPCSWEAMEMGTRGTAMCLRDRQDHHLLSQGAPVQPLVVDQATPVSHRPDGPLMAHCWWRGVMSSAQAHPAGAALQSHASLQGLSGLLHARKAPRDLVTPACPLSPFPLFSSPKV